MATIEAIGLSKRYGARNALDGLTFAADAGDVIGLLGPNGAGKTTTIRLLTTILEPTGGTFTVAGVPGDQPHRIRQRIGVLPESAGYPAADRRRVPPLRGTAVRPEPPRRPRGRRAVAHRGRSRRSRRSADLDVQPGHEAATRDRPGAGQRSRRSCSSTSRRSAWIRPASARSSPRSPTSPGERGATVVLSTHTLTEVEQVCGTVLILDHGRLRAAGPLAEVVAGAGSLSAAFLGLTGGRP